MLSCFTIQWVLHYNYIQCTCVIHMTILSCSAPEHDQTVWESSLQTTFDMILTFSLLEMHTDNSTNCTLLGPVDCDSFYKWIPLNRWPGCHLIRGIAFYLLCISLLYVHHILHCLFPLPQNDRAGSKVWVWWRGLFLFCKFVWEYSSEEYQ